MNQNTTHRNENDVIETVLQLLLDHNEDALAEGFRLLVNEAMKAERNYALNARPYERTEERLGYANGFKPKTGATRLGASPSRCRTCAVLWSSTHLLWKRDCAANAPSNSPWRKCT
jgi:hypothetical protein